MATSIGKAVLEIATDLKGFATKDAERSLKNLGGLSKESMRALQQGAGLALGAVTALAGGIVALGMRGATVGDVQREFGLLSETMGETADTMAGALRRGTVGAISDFELMKVANKAMGAGFKGSAEDMETLASGARLLAKRVGGDTVQSFDMMAKAIATGRTQSLAQLGLFVDTKVALQDYEKVIGKTTGEMNNTERAAALQAATMETLRGVIEAAGPQSADFGEKMAGLKVRMANFTDSLAVAINDSPVVAAGMDAIGAAADQAFGGDQAQLVQRLTGFVNDFAIGLTYGADAVVFLGQRGNEVFTALKVVIAGVSAGVVWMAEQIAGGLESVLAVGEKIPGLGEKFAPARQAMEESRIVLQGMREDYQAQVGEALDGAARNRAAMDTVSAAIGRTRAAMIAARGSQVELSTATRDHVPVVDEQILKLQEQAAAHAKFAADASKATTDFLSTQKFSNDEGIASYQAKIDAQTKLDQEYRALQNQLAEQRMREEAQLYKTTAELAAEAGHKTRAELKATADQAFDLYTRMQESGEFTSLALKEAWTQYEEARRAAAGETARAEAENRAALVSGVTSTLGILGGKFKAAAIAGAIISTYQAVAKSLASAPWPFNLALAAGALAAGMANVSRIRSSDAGFRQGTAGLDFESFNPMGQGVLLHGEEAIIPRGGGHQLAGEIAGGLLPHLGRETAPTGGDPELRSEVRTLRLTMERQVHELRYAFRDTLLQVTR